MPTAATQVMHFEDEVAIVVERYDRCRTTEELVRVHQEDICQALGVYPFRKYQNEGGPGARSVIELLRAHSSSSEEDIANFVDALAFNWLIAGTDAHAKNYSLLIGSHGVVRLAPLYDVASALPYSGSDVERLKLAMKIGRYYRLQDISIRDWHRLAMEAGLNAGGTGPPRSDRIPNLKGCPPPDDDLTSFGEYHGCGDTGSASMSS